jgi:hypothetical protein
MTLQNDGDVADATRPERHVFAGRKSMRVST